MARIQIGGAGGAPSNGFIRSLRESDREDYIIGTSCIASDLFLADVDERHVVPPALADDYPDRILSLVSTVKPDFLHLQNDYEVRAISRLRDQLKHLKINLFLPNPETVEICVNKQKSYQIWQTEGVPVPETILLKTEADLKRAFERFGNNLWLRAIEGAAGRGALPTDSYEMAKAWVDYFIGWGQFTAAAMLSKQTVTWLSIWYEGELVVAQTRRRRSWSFGNRTLSGVTGITGVGETVSDPDVDRVAQDSIFAIDRRPHGIFGVDMAYSLGGIPNPTEINIGRFFTTHYFFTKAGLNLPKIYCDIALEDKFPTLEKTINPLPDGLLWVRGMDVEPALIKAKDLDELERSGSWICK